MKNTSDSIIILILFLVQFIDVLDFMVVMPLGPDFAMVLGVPESKLGWVAGSYAFAAAFSGILSSKFIDRFERKRALIFSLMGLVMANIFSANAWSFETLLASRFLAGAFGGPATSLCFAIVADLFEENRRGSVMGKVMSGFSLAAIFGVPIGLKMSETFGWNASFYTVAALGIIAIILIQLKMPQLRHHLSSAMRHKATYLSLFKKPIYNLSFLAAGIGSMASFMIIPYVSPFLQMNLDLPRADVSLIYSIGGICSFFAMQITGKLVDKTNSALITMAANIFVIFSLLFGCIWITDTIPTIILFAPFMIGMAIRNVSNYTAFSKVATLGERAGFMSIISCIQHLASTCGSGFASEFLTISDEGKLVNMNIIAMIAIGLFLIVPIILSRIEKLHEKMLRK